MKFILLLLIVPLLTGCPKRSEIRAEMWLQSGLPPELCAKYPEIREYGMYRKLNNGKYEIQRYCNPQARAYLAIYKDRFEDLLKEHLPKEK